jgi:hypothetical protein
MGERGAAMNIQLRYAIGGACIGYIAGYLFTALCSSVAGRFVARELVSPLFVIVPILFAVAGAIVGLTFRRAR